VIQDATCLSLIGPSSYQFTTDWSPEELLAARDEGAGKQDRRGGFVKQFESSIVNFDLIHLGDELEGWQPIVENISHGAEIICMVRDYSRMFKYVGRGTAAVVVTKVEPLPGVGTSSSPGLWRHKFHYWAIHDLTRHWLGRGSLRRRSVASGTASRFKTCAGILGGTLLPEILLFLVVRFTETWSTIQQLTILTSPLFQKINFVLRTYPLDFFNFFEAKKQVGACKRLARNRTESSLKRSVVHGGGKPRRGPALLPAQRAPRLAVQALTRVQSTHVGLCEERSKKVDKGRRLSFY